MHQVVYKKGGKASRGWKPTTLGHCSCPGLLPNRLISTPHRTRPLQYAAHICGTASAVPVSDPGATPCLCTPPTQHMLCRPKAYKHPLMELHLRSRNIFLQCCTSQFASACDSFGSFLAGIIAGVSVLLHPSSISRFCCRFVSSFSTPVKPRNQVLLSEPSITSTKANVMAGCCTPVSCILHHFGSQGICLQGSARSNSEDASQAGCTLLDHGKHAAELSELPTPKGCST